MSARSVSLLSRLPQTLNQPIAGPSSRPRSISARQCRPSLPSLWSPSPRSYASHVPRPSRTGPRPGPGRPATAEPEIPNVKDLMSRKSFGDAWRASYMEYGVRTWVEFKASTKAYNENATGLSSNQKLAFGAFVLIGGAGEYYFLKGWIIDSIKAKKEEEKRTALEKDARAAGGAEREVLLGEQLGSRPYFRRSVLLYLSELALSGDSWGHGARPTTGSMNYESN
ncbi:hypothetical protein I316_01388 [Kwoniella heveanensis BCC8398]|uniref:Uncharacterized protein n=1 Tax=Kwoniella heveanensis BCC8398 TaxID=1296120 RepID=A0A1B9H0J0_9TREE|nr:hypothetical protein I316_01388 [Kwoniella heveanensis BCC8398]